MDAHAADAAMRRQRPPTRGDIRTRRWHSEDGRLAVRPSPARRLSSVIGSNGPHGDAATHNADHSVRDFGGRDLASDATSVFARVISVRISDSWIFCTGQWRVAWNFSSVPRVYWACW